MTIHKKKWNSMELVKFCLVRRVFDGYEVQLEDSHDYGVFPCRDAYALGTLFTGYVQGETDDGRPVLSQQGPGVSLAVQEMEKTCLELGVNPQEMVAVMHCADQLSSLIRAVEEGQEQVSFQEFDNDFELDLLKALEGGQLISESDRASLEDELKNNPALSVLDLLEGRKLLEPRAIEIIGKMFSLHENKGIVLGMLMVAFFDDINTNGMVSFEESLMVRGWVVD